MGKEKAESSIVCRRLEKSDLPLLQPLFRAVYEMTHPASFWNHSPSYWEWKYFANPVGDHGMFVLFDKQSNRIGGLVGGIPFRMKAGERSVIAGQSCDVAIHPDYRRGSSFFRLNGLSLRENADRGIALIFGFGTEETRELSLQFLGFKDVCPMEKLTKVLDPSPYLAGRAPRSLAGLLRTAIGLVWGSVRPLRRRRFARIMQASGLTCETIDRFDGRFDELWEKAAGRLDIAVVRDAAHLNWRYADHPDRRYTILAFSGGDALEGYAVLRIVPGEIRRGRIVDVLSASDDPRCLRAFIAAAEDYFLGQGCHTSVCWMPEQHRLGGLMRASGYVPRPTGQWLIVKPLDESLPATLIGHSRWYITMGDTDYF